MDQIYWDGLCFFCKGLALQFAWEAIAIIAATACGLVWYKIDKKKGDQAVRKDRFEILALITRKNRNKKTFQSGKDVNIL